MKSMRFLFVILLGSLILYGCAHRPQKTGIIEGHVTIGPLTPVVREGEIQPTLNPEVYAAREVVIFKSDGKTVFTRLKIDANGNYQAELPVGKYIVDINHSGIDRASGLPMTVEIAENAVTRVDINIDTGIR